MRSARAEARRKQKLAAKWPVALFVELILLRTGLSEFEFGRAVGVNQSTVSRWRNQQLVTVPKCGAAAAVIGLAVRHGVPLETCPWRYSAPPAER